VSTLTNNVNLSASDRRVGDWINELTPSVQFSETTAHTRFNGSVAVPVILYAHTPENNYLAPLVSITGTVEAVEKFFFVDTSINVSQQYSTPFGAHPSNLVNATQNRYTAQSYDVSPYIRGTLADGMDYELRDSNLWTVAGTSGVSEGGNAYTNSLTGHLRREARPGGWSLEYERADTKFTDRQSEITEVARGRALYRVDATLQLSATGGYENNRFLFERDRGPVYGVGVQWHPTDRTNLDASWEHRFFGASYHVSFDHRLPLTVVRLRASRDVTSYPQEIANLPQGANVNALLNSLFASRVPDPGQRQSLVDELIRDRGLSPELANAVTIFSQQITLNESIAATLGVLGARNTIFFTAFRSRDQPVENSPLTAASPLLSEFTDQTQTGTNVVWTHQLMPNMSLSANVDWSRTVSNIVADASTRQLTATAVVSSAISALTNLFAGVRYQTFNSNVAESYQEAAVFVGVSHRFH
jgi:uncharacterized protein (PEP-CTERM system associated)